MKIPVSANILFDSIASLSTKADARTSGGSYRAYPHNQFDKSYN
jgi:hypothetical protein